MGGAVRTARRVKQVGVDQREAAAPLCGANMMHGTALSKKLLSLTCRKPVPQADIRSRRAYP